MKKRTLVILSICIFVISLAMGGGIINMNNNYSFDNYLAKICGGDTEDKKCVYAHVEYNPFTYKHTFYYQVTHEAEIDKGVTDINVIQKGQKNEIEGVLKVANNNNADNWIELGQDVLLVKDANDFKKLKKGDKITKEELFAIASDLDNY